MIIALLTAAGVGSRMGQDIPKQFVHVDNKPIIIYTMEAFQNHPAVDGILVVSLPSWMDILWAYAKQFNISKLRWIVKGGKTNQESIYFGLKKLDEELPEDTTIIIHDGNRCSVSSEVISDALSTFSEYGDSTCGIPCTEAVFESGDEGHSSVISIPREKLVRIQTPIIYPLNRIYKAYHYSIENSMEGIVAPSVLMQKLGETIHFSRGSEENFKITTIDDLMLFKALLHTKKDGWLK